MSREFCSEPTATYLEAVDALRKLLDEQGLDVVTRAYAEAAWESARTQYAEREGIKERSGSHVCVERLLGKRCPGEDHLNSPFDIPGSDHSSEWVKDRKTHAIVSQPYSFSYETMLKTVKFCEENGLRADISAERAWHFPGRVLMVAYKRK